ncbi:hypothetical protein EQ500_05530, partial [Lactobacillus sp. XV13L]|nr:hypothetical protein [Lactobacillus sp. XV13L]
MKGIINSYSLLSYKGPNGLIYQCEGGGNQQNLQTNNITFDSTCTYTGYTYNGNALELSGNATFESGSKVYLYPHGDAPENSRDGMSWGLLLTGNNPQIDLKGSAELHVYCDGKTLVNSVKANNDPNIVGLTTDPVKTPHPCGAIDMTSAGGALKFEGDVDTQGNHLYPTLSIDSDGEIINDGSLVRFTSGSADLSQGSFSIQADNLDKYNTNGGRAGGGLMNVGSGMNINVRTGGRFSIVVGDGHDKDSPLNLLYASTTMKVNIVNPANVTLDLRKDPCDASALVYADGNRSNIITVPSDIVMGPYSIPRGTNVVLAPSMPFGSGNDSNSDIEVYDTKMVAEGNNKATSGNGVAIQGPNGPAED